MAVPGMTLDNKVAIVTGGSLTGLVSPIDITPQPREGFNRQTVDPSLPVSKPLRPFDPATGCPLRW